MAWPKQEFLSRSGPYNLFMPVTIRRNSLIYLDSTLQVHLGYISPSEVVVTWVTGSYQLGAGPMLVPQPLVASTVCWRLVSSHAAPVRALPTFVCWHDVIRF